MDARPLAAVDWYCVRVDHVSWSKESRPHFTIREGQWAYCRSGDGDADHFWALTEGRPLHALYEDPIHDARRRSGLGCIDALRDDLRESIGGSSFSIEVARLPTPLTVSYEVHRQGRHGAVAELELADAHGAVGRVTIVDDARERFTDEELTFARAVIAPYAEPIRAWLGAIS